VPTRPEAIDHIRLSIGSGARMTRGIHVLPARLHAGTTIVPRA